MKFVAIEGLDGSGKSTQIELIKKYLKDNKRPYKFLHFPRTDSPVFGDMVARFLRGEFGKLNEVNPYLVALLYAGDRNDAAKIIREWINDDYFVLVDRYVYSNVAFQCAKLETEADKKSLRKWIHFTEFEYHKIPKPDMSLFLDVPFEFTRKKLTDARTGADRDYLKGEKDIHEASLHFQEMVREVYLWQVETEKDFFGINCMDENGDMLHPDRIFKKIIQKIFHTANLEP